MDEFYPDGWEAIKNQAHLTEVSETSAVILNPKVTSDPRRSQDSKAISVITSWSLPQVIYFSIASISYFRFQNLGFHRFTTIKLLIFLCKELT